jgi:prevent-host-death family protein
MTVNVHQAKTHLSRLLNKARAGEEIIIAKAGKPVAKLVPITPGGRKRPKFGYLKDEIWIAPDFDAPDPELEDLFYNGPIEPANPAEAIADPEDGT